MIYQLHVLYAYTLLVNQNYQPDVTKELLKIFMAWISYKTCYTLDLWPGDLVQNNIKSWTHGYSMNESLASHGQGRKNMLQTRILYRYFYFDLLVYKISSRSRYTFIQWVKIEPDWVVNDEILISCRTIKNGAHMYAKARSMFLNACLYTLKSCTAWANCSTNIWFPSTSLVSRPIGVSICSSWRYLVQAKKILGRTCVSYRHLNQR